ncbi:MAG: GGDEF domain-containing protein [Butyrivibrio sp.]|jgi:diguanylate cyclase (GGDEF)-like protein|nr:GGDEF domain-containing protein [Butyrivibrio sp.]
MEEAVLFCAFRVSGIGLLLMMLVNVHRNRNNRRKMFLIYRMMIFALPLILLNLLWYLCDRMLIPGGAPAALAFRILCYGAVAAETVLTLLYGKCYIRVPHSAAVPALRILKYIPAVLLVLISILDMEQTVTVIYLMMGAFLLHNNTLSQLISLDPLTRLNNRSEFRNYLSAKMALPTRGRLCLLMMDMNGFKSINDTYGHLEGDAALKRVSMCLKKACADVPGRPFIARYGGDEFIVVAETDNNFETERICDSIHMTLALENHKAQAPYQLTVSIGTARCDSSMHTIYDLVARADQELYRKKQKRKRMSA